MSWGSGYGSYGGEDYGSASSGYGDGGLYGGSTGSTKRPSYQHDGNQTFKKPRGGGSGGYDGPSSWDNAGAMSSSFDAYGGGSYPASDQPGSQPWDRGSARGRGRGSYRGKSGGSEGTAYSVSSELESWDEFSSGGLGAGGRGRGTGNRGGNRGGSSYVGASSYGNYDDGWGDGSFGGGSSAGGKTYGAGNNGGGNKGFGGRGGAKSFGGKAGKASGGRGGSGFGGRGKGAERGGAGIGRGRGRGGYIDKGSDQKQYQYDASMTLVQKFQRFINFLKTDKVQRPNSIQSLENACMITNCGLKTNYYTEELPRIYNRQIFTGKASIGGIYLARGVGCNKKELKHEVFNKAHKILLNKSIEDINNLKDPGLDMVRASVEKYLTSLGKGTYIEGQGTPVYKPLTDIMNEITNNLESISGLAIGLKKLTAYLKGPLPLPENPISKLEQAMIASKCGLQHMYKFECVVLDDGIVFEGVFILEDTPIARATNDQKKICKQETYLAAINALLTKDVNDLVVPVEKENVNQEEEDKEHTDNEAIVRGVSLPDGEAPPPIMKPSLREAPMIDKVKNLVSELSLTAFTDNNVTVVDNCVINSGLTAMRIYKRLQVVSEDCSSCELFIDNIHISTGLGSQKTECMLDAYNNAWEVLTSSPAEDILANHRRLAPNETTDPFVLDVVVRGGGGANMESNLGALRKRGFEPDDPSRSMKDLVIVELSNWWRERKRSAFCILQTSATFSGLLLQWSFTTLKPVNNNSYKNESKPMSKMQVVFYLQGNKVAEHTAYGKSKVRNFASAEILYKLYETQDVLRACTVNASEVCVKYSTIQAEADELRVQAGEIKQEPETDILVERKSDRFIVNAVRNRIDTFFTTPPNPLQEDLYLGPGLNDIEVREVRAYALSKNLFCNIKPYLGETYMVLKPRVELKNIVKALKESGKSSYGTYQLVPKSECPNYASLDVKGKLEVTMVSKN